MLDVLVICLGAIAGANARYFMSRYAAQVLGPVFPYGTLVINIAGSFIVGFFVIWTTERVLVDPRWRLLVVVGFCGSFTTFSSYAFESMAYFEQGQWMLMFTNFFSNNFLCLAGRLGGYGAGEGAVKWQMEWPSKSRFILTKSDQWHHRPLHAEILNYLRQENVYAATALHAVAGFLGRQQVKTSHLVDAGGKLPVIIIFVDTDEHVSRVLPKLKEMAAHRLIVRENVVLEQGNLD